MPPSPAEIIVKKRDGSELSDEEISHFVRSFHEGGCTSDQMASFCMAVYLQGMTSLEIASLTNAMARTGQVLDWGGVLTTSSRVVDKHSTGGVGDKVSLVLAPLAASFGLLVPMMSGRGLGHTGGTLDKLESITGFRTRLSTEDVMGQVAKDGLAIFAPTADIAPVDRAIYALRDVCGSTESLPLIASSIMSKKIGENPRDGLVLDVKTGSGAFLQDWAASVELAKAMLAAGAKAGIPTAALFTSMDQPLGRTVGNFLEVAEAIRLCAGRVSEAPDVAELAVHQVALLLQLARHPAAPTRAAAIEAARQSLISGRAREYLEKLVVAQGGDVSLVRRIADCATFAEAARARGVPQAKVQLPVLAPCDGFVASIDTKEIGLASVSLGAGRQTVDDKVDPAAGFLVHVKLGDRVAAGSLLMTAFGNSKERVVPAVERAVAAFELTVSQPPAPPPLISHVMLSGSEEMETYPASLVHWASLAGRGAATASQPGASQPGAKRQRVSPPGTTSKDDGADLERHRALSVPLAVDAMQRACCKHSKYKVGACLLSADGRTFSGVNVESDTYGLTVCAERCALFKALADGAKSFVHLACATKDAGISCGACRQLLSEYCPPSMPVDFTDAKGNIGRATTVEKMMPDPFVLK